MDDPGSVMREERQPGWLGAGRDDGLVEADARGAAVVRGDLDLVRGQEPAGALDGGDLPLPRQAGQASGEPADDTVFPAAQRVQVDLRVAEPQPVAGHL